MSNSANAPLGAHATPPSAPRHALRCNCGSFRAVLRPPRGTRAVCYCHDCQAFAHYLGLPEGMLDEAGGTPVVAVRPRHVVVVAGAEHLACMSLTERGMLRWYTRCCNTPIGNTPRSMRQHYLGLVHTCLEGGSAGLEASFGPVKMRVNRHGAKSPIVPGAGVHLRAGAVARHRRRAVGARERQVQVQPVFRRPQRRAAGQAARADGR